jgi:hypothetical protein
MGDFNNLVNKVYSDKLYEELAWGTGENLVSNCHKVSHSKDYFIAVFWYNLSTKELVLSTDFNVNHNNAEIYRDDSKENWIKGRVFNYKKILYTCLYWRYDKTVTKQSLRDLVSILNKRLNLSVEVIVDYDGEKIEID